MKQPRRKAESHPISSLWWKFLVNILLVSEPVKCDLHHLICLEVEKQKGSRKSEVVFGLDSDW